MKPEKMEECLWYRQPAKDDYDGWEQQALPIGNGDLGCKIFGGIQKEHIQFNEKSLWTGTVLGVKEQSGEINTNGNGKLDYGKTVKKIQELLEKGKVEEATVAMEGLQGDEIGFGAYQDFGHIYLGYSDLCEKEATDYVRCVNLEDGVAYTGFTYKEQRYERQYFLSYPDQVGVIRLRGSHMCVQFRVEGGQSGYSTEYGEWGYRLYGHAGGDVENGLAYEAYFSLQTDGQTQVNRDGVFIEEASEITIIFSAATNYKMEYPSYRNEKTVLEKVKQRVCQAKEKGYATILENHKMDYQALYGRTTLSLFEENEVEQWALLQPTDVLLEQYKAGKRSRLLERKVFLYGRFLLITSSREGGLPANLQGVWNGLNAPPWQSDYHLNINLQMNYWLAMNTNLTETAKPLVDYMNQCLVIPGRITAYHCVGCGNGNVQEATGWMAHTQNNIFGHTGPGSNWQWGWAPTVGAFILENVYEYYRFTKDLEYLEKKIYPAMEEAALMWDGLLVWDEKSERLVVSPCFSPEHGPVTVGNTFDQEMIWQLFANVLEAAKALQQDNRGDCVNRELIQSIINKKPKLQPLQIGKWGQIKEWEEEDCWENRGFTDKNVIQNHRHFSHLMGLYPGHHITTDNQEWMKAACISMEDRKDFGIDATPGWSKALKMGAWARLLDKEKCDFYIHKIIAENTCDNLFMVHPPFQIDANFGATAGMAEALLQSNGEAIYLLPALPTAWKKGGNFQGLLARGNITVDCTWENETVIAASFCSPTVSDICVFANGKKYNLRLQPEGHCQLQL